MLYTEKQGKQQNQNFCVVLQVHNGANEITTLVNTDNKIETACHTTLYIVG